VPYLSITKKGDIRHKRIESTPHDLGLPTHLLREGGKKKGGGGRIENGSTRVSPYRRGVGERAFRPLLLKTKRGKKKEVVRKKDSGHTDEKKRKSRPSLLLKRGRWERAGRGKSPTNLRRRRGDLSFP